LAQAQADTKNSTLAGEIKNILTPERVRNSWHKTAVVNRKTSSGKVTKVWVTRTSVAPDGSTRSTRVECTTKLDMENAAMAENERRFTQCLDTSGFFDSRLQTQIGMQFDGPAVPSVLDGSWAPTPDLLDLFYETELLEYIART
jgi:hypothetical protein